MSTLPRPELIATSFIKQYYHILCENPADLHKFYNETSSFTHCEDFQPTEIHSGSASIQAKISTLNLKGSQIDLSDGSLDAQRSDNNGIVVMVTGSFAAPDQDVPRRFLQTFFLTCSAGGASYFVGNSMFRLTEEKMADADVPVPPCVPSEEPVAATSIEDTAAAVVAVEAPSPIPEEPEPAPAPAAVVEQELERHESKVAGAAAAAAVEETASEMMEALAVTASVPVMPAPAPIPVPVLVPAPEPSGPRSYLDILRKTGGGGASVGAASAGEGAAAAAATATSSSGTNNGFRVMRERPRPSGSRPAAVASTTPPVQEIGGGTGGASSGGYSSPATFLGKPSYSIYVKQLPETATVAEIEALFAPYGPVAQVDAQLGRSFAFVRFEQASSLRAVLEKAAASSAAFELRGAVLRVEERNSASKSGSGGRGGAGMGGSGSRAPRGVIGSGRERGGGDRDREREGGGGRDRPKSAPRKDGSQYRRAGDSSASSNGARPSGAGGGRSSRPEGEGIKK